MVSISPPLVGSCHAVRKSNYPAGEKGHPERKSDSGKNSCSSSNHPKWRHQKWSEAIQDSSASGVPSCQQHMKPRGAIAYPNVQSCEQIHGLFLCQTIKFWGGCYPAIITEPPNWPLPWGYNLCPFPSPRLTGMCDSLRGWSKAWGRKDIIVNESKTRRLSWWEDSGSGLPSAGQSTAQLLE